MKLPAFRKTYGQRTVLDFPGMDLASGQICAVIGANGSGKSTLAKILAGALEADSRKSPADFGPVGYLPQKPFAFRMSVKANLLLGSHDAARADQLMDALQISQLAGKRADRLSGGETARMALARLMMHRYDLVILDEPTAAMDMESTVLAEAAMARYVKETGCALLLVTHSLQQARRLADTGLYLHRGQLLESGPAETIFHTPRHPETRQFLEFYGM